MSNGVIQDVARGDRLNIGTSLIDQTMGGCNYKQQPRERVHAGSDCFQDDVAIIRDRWR